MYARHVEHVSTRAARRRSAQYELSNDESSSPQTAHLARENRHAVAQRPQISERGEPAMNSPLSSAITDTWAGPPQTGQAVRDGADRGEPVVVSDPSGVAAQELDAIASRLLALRTTRVRTPELRILSADDPPVPGMERP